MSTTTTTFEELNTSNSLGNLADSDTLLGYRIAGSPGTFTFNSAAILDLSFSANGILTRTAASTYASRTMTGTADVITITNGDGVAGNPTFTIASTYAGQASIVTLGTVTTGTWSADSIALNKITALTANKALVSDVSGFLSVSATTDTELGYVSGVTSAIQTQMDTKITASSTDTLTNKTFDADGTGNSITNIENADIKAAAAIAVDKLAATTASRALVSDASGFITAATTTDTEIGYVNGVTSAIQTQIDTKITSSSSDTLTNKTIVATSNTISDLPYDVAFVAGFNSVMVAEDIVVQSYGQLVMSRTGSIVGEAGYIDTVATGSALIVDIEKNGTTVYTTKPQFGISSNTLTAGTLKTDGSEDFVSGDRITFKVTQIGSTIAGQGARFTIKCEV